jgi:general secretion pathway protein C
MPIQRIIIVINLVLITAIAYLGVTLFYGIIDYRMEGSPKQKTAEAIPIVQASAKNKPLSYYAPVMERDLFQTKAVQAAEETKEDIDIEALEETQLKLKLWGTVSGSAESAYAVIEDTQTRKQNLYRVDDVIQQAKLKAIFRERVVLVVNGKDEILTMEKAQQTAAVSRSAQPQRQSTVQRSYESESEAQVPTPAVRSQRVSLNRSMIENAMEDVSKLMTEITVTPHIAEDGQQSGLALKNIKPNSIFRRMGLRNGDVLVGVDGNPIESVDDALGLYENLKTSSDVQVQILRRGQQRTIDYRIR